MKYINANEILPDVLVEELQKYVQAGYIYILAKSEQHKSWGNCLVTGRNLTDAVKPSLRSMTEEFLLGNLLINTIFRCMPSEK